MDCDTCNDLLLDLAYGELDEVRAAAVRKHADGCAECQRALGRMTRGRALARQLPREEPPAVSDALRAAIAAAASVAAASVAGPSAPRAEAPAVAAATPPPDASAEASRASVEPADARPTGALARWLERVGEVAMRRQVAMAAVFLVTIGVGLIFYQTHPRPTDAHDDRVPDVVPAVEVAGQPQPRGAHAAHEATVRRPPVGVGPGRALPFDREEQRARAGAQVAPTAAQQQAQAQAALREPQGAPDPQPAPAPRAAEVARAEAERPADPPAAAAPAEQENVREQRAQAAQPAAQAPQLAQAAQPQAADDAVNFRNDTRAPSVMNSAGAAARAGNNAEVAQRGAVDNAQGPYRALAPGNVGQLQTAYGQAQDDVSRARIALELATALIQQGRTAEAHAYLSRVRGTPEQNARANQMLAGLGSNRGNAANTNQNVAGAGAQNNANVNNAAGVNAAPAEPMQQAAAVHQQSQAQSQSQAQVAQQPAAAMPYAGAAPRLQPSHPARSRRTTRPSPRAVDYQAEGFKLEGPARRAVTAVE